LREKVAKGLLISLQPPTNGMMAEAVSGQSWRILENHRFTPTGAVANILNALSEAE
jgi:hypothetical protein